MLRRADVACLLNFDKKIDGDTNFVFFQNLSTICEEK
jgi:stress response protein SCP2